MTVAVLSGLVRPLVEPHLPPGIEARWYTSVEELLALAPEAEIGWFDLDKKEPMIAAVRAAGDLRWLNSIYAGLDFLPLDLLAEREVTITNGAGINALTIAEYVVMLMLVHAKGYRDVVRAQDRREWLLDSPGKIELAGSRALLLGTGAIGGLVKTRLEAFEVEVVPVRRTAAEGALGPDEWRPRLGEFDWIILAVPATPETDAIIGAAELGWARDTRDSVIYPTKGSTQRVNVEVSLPPGSLRYYKASYQHQRYFPLFWDFVLMLNGDVGYGDGYSDKPLPFYKNYFAGGIGSVRGFQTSSLGERDRDAAGNILFNTVGGNRRIVGNAELLFPLPGSQDKTLRLGTFIDAGQVWASGDSLSLGDLRYSAGLSVAWSSPMGPLKFSIAQPLNKEPTDRLQRFQFQLGSTF